MWARQLAIVEKNLVSLLSVVMKVCQIKLGLRQKRAKNLVRGSETFRDKKEKAGIPNLNLSGLVVNLLFLKTFVRLLD